MTTQRRIDDFGEHIPGARKDLFGGSIASVEAAVGDTLPQRLTEAWPAPPWEKLAEAHAADNRGPEELAFLRALRDYLRTPRGWKNEHWLCRPGQDGGGMLQIALDQMEGRTSVDQGLARVEALANRDVKTLISNTATLYRTTGHARDLGTLRCFKYQDRHRIGKPASGRTGVYRSLVTADTLAAAAAKLPEVLARLEAKEAERKNDESGPSPYQLRWFREGQGQQKIYRICRQHAGRWIHVHECAARRKTEAIAESLDRIRNHRDELDAWFERWRTLPESRNRENEPRSPAGEAGTDDPDEFTERFAFRGVQFGNWVSGSRRRTDLYDASQGLEDLATVLGWPVRALSLGSALGLAFGARGHGGPQRTKAHYEPGLRVIAISKPAGPGSLAHEWFHALDHETSRLASSHGHGFATEMFHYFKDADSPASQLARTMHAYGCLLQTLGLLKRSKKLDHRRPKSKPYWSTTRELAARAFEAWIRWRLAGMGIRNDYLVNIAPASRWTGPDEIELGYPYPTNEELQEIDEKLSAVADAGRALAPQWCTARPDGRPAAHAEATSAARFGHAALQRR